jgi:SNW domain-containing protein 1
VPSEALYDSRLFNQSAGMSSGFEAGDDAYNIYDKALFSGSLANQIYKPKRANDEFAGGVDNEKIEKLLSEHAPHQGFQGADYSNTARDGPVAFEKEADVFGMDAFMHAAKRGRDKDKESANKKTRVD